MEKYSKIIKYNDDIRVPILRVVGKKKGPKIVITGGIHGCEYSPIKAIYKIYEMLIAEKIKGEITLIPIFDLKGFEARKMFNCPIDNKNINRVFPGKKTGSFSEILVYNIFNDYIKQADYYIDLHSADLIEDMIPFIEVHQSGNKDIDERSFKLAEHYGIKDITIKRSKGKVNDMGQSYSTSAENGVTSILANAGKIRGSEGENIHVHGLYNILKYTGNISGNANKVEDIVYYDPPVHIKSKAKGIFISNLNPGDFIKKGEKVGDILDYTGNMKYSVKAPTGGKILLINVSLAVNEDSLLIEIFHKK